MNIRNKVSASSASFCAVAYKKSGSFLSGLSGGSDKNELPEASHSSLPDNSGAEAVDPPPDAPRTNSRLFPFLGSSRFSSSPQESYFSSCPAVFALSGPALNQALWFFIFLAGAASYYYLARRKRILEKNPPDPWADRDTVENVLILAAEQNAPLRLEAREHTAGLAPLTGLCLGYDEKSLTIQLFNPLPSNIADMWIGRDVSVFLHVVSGHNLHFYRFESLVFRHQDNADCPLLEIARPVRLSPFQRRHDNRLKPTLPLVLGVGVWPVLPLSGLSSIWLPEDSSTAEASLTEKSLQLDASPASYRSGRADRPDETPPAIRVEDWAHGVFPLPSSPADLNKPLFAYYPAKSATVRLANISASGLALRIHRSRVAEIPEACVVFISLSGKADKTLNLWLACRKKHVTVQSGRATAVVGLQLVEWCRVGGGISVSPESGSHISWNKVNSRGEVKPLYNWIIRHEAAQRRAHAKFINL